MAIPFFTLKIGVSSITSSKNLTYNTVSENSIVYNILSIRLLFKLVFNLVFNTTLIY